VIQHPVLDLNPQEWTAIALSLKVAAVATLVSLPFAIAAAMLIGRCRFYGRPLLNALILLPPVVTGYVLLLFGRKGLIDAWLADTFGIVLPADGRGARLDGDAAAVSPGHHRRYDPLLRARYGRVRRENHLRVEYPGRDADPADADLHVHASPRRGCRGTSAHAGRWQSRLAPWQPTLWRSSSVTA